MIYLLLLLLSGCIVLAGLAIAALFRQTQLKRHHAFKFLQYAAILLFTYGFYGNWSTVLYDRVITRSTPNDFIANTSDYIYALSLPFLLTGLGFLAVWVIQQSAVKECGGIKKCVTTPALIVVAATLVMVLAMYWTGVSLGVRRVSALCIFGVFLFAALYQWVRESEFLQGRVNAILAGCCMLVAVIQLPSLLTASTRPVLELIEVSGYFLFISAYIFIFLKVAVRPQVSVNSGDSVWADFAGQYAITERELQVVLEIYKGKTNQEIADTLFLSLQTIKDHSSRIYQKVRVKNRGQLMRLLRELSG